MSNKIALDALTKFVKNAEQSVFEDWLEAKSPSGDVEQVQRQWENSSVYIGFCAKWADAFAAIAALQAEPQPAKIDRDAERGRLLLKWLRDGRIPGPAWGRPIKLVETCPQFGDETEVNNIERLLDAALPATPPKD